MTDDRRIRRAGALAMVGGALGLALTPVLVTVKYSTGWRILPEPAWIGWARPMLEPLTSYATPVQLWVAYGFAYTLALGLMLAGLVALHTRTRPVATPAWRAALGALLAGVVMVLVGDALHTATWHAGGATLPKPNLNPVATAGISIEYLGLPLVLVASLALGVLALRRSRLSLPAALLLAATPAGIALTVSQLPAMPSGPLAVFSCAMIATGIDLVRRRSPEAAPAVRHASR